MGAATKEKMAKVAKKARETSDPLSHNIGLEEAYQVYDMMEAGDSDEKIAKVMAKKAPGSGYGTDDNQPTGKLHRARTLFTTGRARTRKRAEVIKKVRREQQEGYRLARQRAAKPKPTAKTPKAATPKADKARILTTVRRGKKVGVSGVAPAATAAAVQ